ncbi:MAG: TOBE domain-containing protein [Paraburkholderia tropica]|uniref:TOBE domain-containing protein n=1 Tax=Paraburkholderia TaxID=1822464 RepID=UPI0019811239|nr:MULTISPECIES: TOBE domain-containing protein [Paraburkholderia]MBN3811886.1 transporter [Paraburkholderia sp. Ac-20347]
MRTSARNHFVGQVIDIKSGPMDDEVILRTLDELDVVAIITRGSARSLGLAKGVNAFALVKASSVIVLVDYESGKVSARNYISGKIASITKGAVSSEIQIAVPSGASVVAIVTNESVERLGLSIGKSASAIFKASSVIVGVE